MAHMGRAEGYEEEFSDDDAQVDGVGGRMRYGNADKYIKKITGRNAFAISDSNHHDDIPQSRKRQRAPGIKVEFDEDSEPEDVYKQFQERKKTARKRENEIKKKAKLKQKNVAAGQRTLVESDSEEEMVDAVPEYIVSRRKEFDKNFNNLATAGLLLPPEYSGIDLLNGKDEGDLREKPNFPDSVEPSRAKEDVELRLSGGIIPAPVAQYLRTYQIEGVQFLHKLFVYQQGGILGDDMGLGKTVQVAVFLTAAFGKSGDDRDARRMRKMQREGRWYPKVLIVCPGSLIENWKQELARWGWWNLDAYHGDEKEAVYESVKAGHLEIVITTYQTYRNYKHQLNLITWDCVVADECHQLKERKSALTQAMNEINALCRIGLTGTAIQNKYEELWTLLNWTNPGRFGAMTTWKASICEPLKMGQSHDATASQLSVARTTARKLVDNLLPPFFLRRMKSLIAHQLPKKTDHVVFCPLTEVQREAYETFLESPLVVAVKFASDPCPCMSGLTVGRCCHIFIGEDNNIKWQSLVFPVIQTLQKLSNHLALLIPHSDDVHEKRLRDLEYLKLLVPSKWKELYENRDSLLSISNTKFCGKWQILKKLLNFWHSSGDKVLVFSHSVRLLKILRLLFQNTSYDVSFLDGTIPYPERQQIVDDFNGDPKKFVFLISTKAGGVGLNITSANKVVIMDPNWNPSYDLQAQDRAYRIGQTRDVQVFRLVSAGTIEEIVYARQIYKQQQASIGYNASMERRYFKGVQSLKDHQGEIFGLLNLLTFHGDDVVLRDIVNKTNVAEMRAGVQMVCIDADAEEEEDNPLRVDNNNEEAAISELAALMAGDDAEPGKKPKKKLRAAQKADPIQAILASAGVNYTHENSEVVGSSKIEERLSSRAQETSHDVGAGDERIFGSSQPDADDPIEDDDMENPRQALSGFNYRYHAPEEVMKRQFATMAQTFDRGSVAEFALEVEKMTQKERTDLLTTFYRKRRIRLAELEKEDEGEEVVEKKVAGGKTGNRYERVYPNTMAGSVDNDGNLAVREQDGDDDDDDDEL